MLTSKHNAGIYATLDHAANAAGQVKITQGGTIAGRKGVYARAGRASVVTIAAGMTTSETRAAMKQPLIDVTWTGSFSHGTSVTVAQERRGPLRGIDRRVAHAIAIAQEVETEKAMRDGSDHLRYGSPAGIEAQVMSWRDVMTQVAKGDDPGTVAANAAAGERLLFGRASANDATKDSGPASQFIAAFRNCDMANSGPRYDSGRRGQNGHRRALDGRERTTRSRPICSVDDAMTRRTLLQNVLAQSLSDEEKAVLRAVATDTGLTDAVLDAALPADATAEAEEERTGTRCGLCWAATTTEISASPWATPAPSRPLGATASAPTTRRPTTRTAPSTSPSPLARPSPALMPASTSPTPAARRPRDWGQSLNLDETVMLRQQFVTVNGMVTGGTDAAVHLAGGGALLVGDKGRVVAGSSGRAILVNDPGRSGIVIRGEVRGGSGSGDDAVAAIDTTGGGDILLRGDGRVVLADGATNAIRAARTTPGSDETTRVVVSVDGQNVYRNNAGDAVARLGGAVVGNAIPDSDGDGSRTSCLPPPTRRHHRHDEGRASRWRHARHLRCPDGAVRVHGGGVTHDDDVRRGHGPALPALRGVAVGAAGDERPSEPRERLSAPRDAHGAWARVETASGEWQAADSTRTDVAYDHGRYGAARAWTWRWARAPASASRCTAFGARPR